jgi:hypothetical protein
MASLGEATIRISLGMTLDEVMAAKGPAKTRVDRFRRVGVGLSVKQVNIFGEKDRGGISHFSSTFVGLRVSVGF